MHPCSSPAPSAVPIRCEQATAVQQAQVLAYLPARLCRHFPDLPPASWAKALAEFQPELLLTGDQVTLPPDVLTHFVQYLADSPEFVPLDPPIYGPAARHLAQLQLYWAELAVWVLPELEAAPAACGPRVHALLQTLAHAHGVAETVVQAFAWGPHVGRPLPPGLPGGGPAPGSATVQQRLRALAPIRGPTPPAER